MASRKLTNFLGIAPKISGELLPDRAAQSAVNVKLFSGDLLPYRSPAEITNVLRSGTVKTIYPMTNPSTGAKEWLTWLNDVDIAVATSNNDEEQRIYYTGDGVPKVTNYEMAVSGGGPWPVDWYELGLPLPTVTPTAVATAASALSLSNVSRDGDNIATYVTSTAHGYRTGLYVTVSGFSILSATYSTSSATDDVTVTFNNIDWYPGVEVYLIFKSGDMETKSGYYTVKSVAANTFTCSVPGGISNSSGNVEIDMRGFNIKAAEIVVIDSTTFTAFSNGPKQTTTGGTFATDFGSGIEVELSGTEIGRTYVYTWMTPWNEESIPSEPSEDIYVKEGQLITISDLPVAPPAGDNFIRGFRIYRTVTDTTGSSYFLLRTVWFPRSAVSASRTSNIVTITLDDHHNLEAGDLIKIDGMEFGGVPDTSFDVVDVEVLEVIDDTSFTYTAAGSDKVLTATTAGTLYYDIAEFDSGTSRYYETDEFIDDYDVGGLAIELDSLDAEAPDPDMTGLIVTGDNIMVGFVGNELCFSDPDKPWSWPSEYRLVMDSNIVALELTAGSIVVLTETYPYIVTGNTPANMYATRADVLMPCVSKRGVVNMGYGVLFPTNQGIGIYGPTTGADTFTKLIHDWDTWSDALDPTTIVAEYYNGKYFASHSTGSFILERDDQVGGVYVTTPIRFYSAHYDPLESRFYYMADTVGQLAEWDAAGEPFLSMEWKSKVFVDTGYTSIGAVRVIADYGDTADDNEAINDYNDGVPAYNAAIWALVDELGTVNGPNDYVDPNTSDDIPVYGALNSFEINGDPLTIDLLSTAGLFTIGFRVWANKILQSDVTLTTSDIYRLPANYRSDTIEVAVSGSARVRAIHIGETPYNLRTV